MKKAVHMIRPKWLVIMVVVAVALLLAASGGSAAPATAPVSTLFLQADTVLGTVNLTGPEMPAKACIQTSRYAHNEEIVFRIRVVDPQTGEAMDDQGLQSVSVLFPDGDNMEAKYATHGGTDSFWTVAWTVPPDYPTGTLTYEIDAVANDGRTGSFVPFNVGPSLTAITDEARPIVNSQ